MRNEIKSAGMFIIHDHIAKDKYIAEGTELIEYDSGHPYEYIMYNRLWSEKIGCVNESRWIGFKDATIIKIPIEIDKEELLCEPEEVLAQIKLVMAEEFI